ncbi:serine hydrolase [Mucilaginibacter agri]|uniref:Serine hydrolase n=1 Tax=Mucilaginibacter agri TaxID=2695265 RepID=A0A966DUG0_9SPHI|nr:serine hydrolase [Mucilaginibacter agri]NCD69609.1 serine hydrolase [Mucilaginibacter agri]
MKYHFTYLLFSFLFPVFGMAQSAKQIAAFDQYVQKGVTDWEVPGLAIIVVKDNKVVFKKGYGVLEKGKAGMVDTQTMFGIASTTKAMTAACAGILVDEGKLHWEDKVTDYLPDFQLYDPYATRELTVRDLFLHDSGVGNTDYLWGMMDIKSDEMLRKLRLVKPQYSFRSGFVYQNMFYLAAGKVIEKASGMPWETFIKTQIFEPLHMTRTVASIKDTKGLDNLTSAHMKIDSVIKKVPLDATDQIGPAGGVWSCVDDMGRWLQCMLDSTKYGDNKRLLKADTWAYLLAPHTLVTEEEFYPTAQLTHPHWETYGMGWFQQDYKGQMVNFHTGSLSGLIAINGMLVDKKMGVYLLANLDHAELRHALMFRAFDTFALGGETDWSADFLKLYKGIQEKQDKVEKETIAKRVMGTKPSLPLSDYASKYTDPLYGEVNVKVDKDSLVVDINHILTATVTHWHYDTFVGNYSNIAYGKGGVSFTLDPISGNVSTINIDGFTLNKVN